MLNTAFALFALAQAAAVQPQTPLIDPARHYSGVWMEVGRTPMPITKGCVAATTVYKRVDERRVAVEDDCRQGGVDGKRKAIKGDGVIEDPGVNRRLKVSYLPFVTWRYEVLDQDPAGAWFISASPDRRKIFLFTRAPASPELLKSMTDRARALGYQGEIEYPAPPPVGR